MNKVEFENAMSAVLTTASNILYLYLKEQGGWIPAKQAKQDLGLMLNCVPVSNPNEKSNRPQGWVFGALARMLEEKGQVEFRKEKNRSYYKAT
jgi:hypothetical protein